MNAMLMKRHEVCEALGVSGETLTKMVEAGTLKPVKLHRHARARFWREDVVRIGRKKEYERHD